MKLNLKSIRENLSFWKEKGYFLPEFDLEKVRSATVAAPEWIHFGAGNIFRAFIANSVQGLLNAGYLQKGLIVAEGYDYEIIDRAYQPFDNMCISVTLKVGGAIEKAVVASIFEALKMDPVSEDYARIREVLTQPSLKLASFTLTEKGYRIKDTDGAILPAIQKDFGAGPAAAESYLGKVCAMLHARYQAGACPIALVSMDNCSHNGTRLAEAMCAFADAWEANGLVDSGFAAYVHDRDKVSFPWTMIDKITPRPDPRVVEIVRADGVEDIEAIKTQKGTFVAPFVNAEETQYLVIEDWFPNGRPTIENAAGIMFADRETVDKVERMKVCTCLNPLHTGLAIFGCLLGYERISDEMKDADLSRLVNILGYREGLPVVINPGVLDPREFIDTVIQKRLPNPYMPDTPQRIATDTSQKLGIRFGQTIKAYLADPDLHVADLRLIPLVFAGWLRYAMGLDDAIKPFTPSDDPLLGQIQAQLASAKIGMTDVHAMLEPILSNEKIFGVNLYEAGVAPLCEQYFVELAEGSGAVRRALRRHTLESLVGGSVYPNSIHETAHGYVAMVNMGDRDLLLSMDDTLGFAGEKAGKGTLCPLTHENAEILRGALPFTAPRRVLGEKATMGVGDRLGICTPGHIRAFRKYPRLTPVFAQQSIRELNFTNRTFENVLDDVSYAVLREGFTAGFGADGDHLKTDEEVRYALSCGYTMLTLDCSEHIRGDVTDENFGELYQPAPEMEALYLNREFDCGEGYTVRFDEKEFKKAVLIYAEAIRFAARIYHEYVETGDGTCADFEVSIDETATPTTPTQHYFVAAELKRLGVQPISVAPRFCGEFQKGIDYKGEIERFDEELKVHAAIARHFGYKISVHSGSDKFSIFPSVGRETRGNFHLKTAGTNWLQAMLLIAKFAPGLYRRVHAFALDAFDVATKFYHVTTNLDNIPPLHSLTDAQLPELFVNDDARQLIHITYGLILNAKDDKGEYLFRTELFGKWREYSDELETYVAEHIECHMAALLKEG